MAVVNYQILNIGELLHLLPCDLLRNNVRVIEKLNKRFINAKYGKKFNETCISEKLFPKFTYIYIVCVCSELCQFVVNLYQFAKIVWNSCHMVILGQFVSPKKITKI